jgi:hypothetical protein
MMAEFPIIGFTESEFSPSFEGLIIVIKSDVDEVFISFWNR